LVQALRVVEPLHRARHGIDRTFIEAERLADIAHRAFACGRLKELLDKLYSRLLTRTCVNKQGYRVMHS
jgi:hypothetical protein